MINKLILILVLTAGSCDSVPAAYSDWSEKEQQQYRTFATLQIIDTAQTARLINCQKHTSCSMVELNPLYGDRPSLGRLLGLKLVSNFVMYKALDHENIDRSRALKWLNGVTTIAVVNNGIQIRREF